MTSTRTGTWSASNVWEVMKKVLDDLMNHVATGLCDRTRAVRLYEDIAQVLVLEAAEAFQFQYNLPQRTAPRKGTQYSVNADGSVQGGDESGGLDLYSLPAGTDFAVTIRLNDGPNAAKALAYLNGRGWGGRGDWLAPRDGNSRVYAHNGYALTRTEVGD